MAKETLKDENNPDDKEDEQGDETENEVTEKHKKRRSKVRISENEAISEDKNENKVIINHKHTRKHNNSEKGEEEENGEENEEENEKHDNDKESESGDDIVDKKRKSSDGADSIEIEILDDADEADSKRTKRQANTYAAKKTVAQGMMDIALITANANQLRYLIEFNRHSSTFYVNVILIVLSLLLQVGVGISLIFKGRMDLRGQSKHRHAKRINNYVVVGVFLVTIINVFVASFTVTGAGAGGETSSIISNGYPENSIKS